jgi:hypothetical protein
VSCPGTGCSSKPHSRSQQIDARCNQKVLEVSIGYYYYDRIGEEERMSTSLIEEERHATFRRRPCWKPVCLWCDGKCLTSFSRRKPKQAVSEHALFLSGHKVRHGCTADERHSPRPAASLWLSHGRTGATPPARPTHRPRFVGDDQATVHRKICNTRLRPVREWTSIPTRISRREEKDINFGE